MTTTDCLRTTIDLRVSPSEAFRIFTEDTDAWWKHGRKYRPMKTGTMLFEPGVGGRLLQKSASGDEYELGSILKWEPGRTLEFEWRLDNFEDDQLTVVKVDFSKIASSTRIHIEHSGWDSLPADHAARHGKTSVAFISLRTAWWDSLLLAYRDSDLMKTKA